MAKEEKKTNDQTTGTPENTDIKQDQANPVTVDVAAIIEAAKQAAKAEAMAELKAEMQAEKEAAAALTGKVKPTPMTAEEIKYWDELVDYDAPFFEDAEEEITVGHNGTLYKIKRGESVKIPRKVKQVLLDSEKQKMEFARLKKGLKNQELQA